MRDAIFYNTYTLFYFLHLITTNNLRILEIIPRISRELLVSNDATEVRIRFIKRRAFGFSDVDDSELNSGGHMT